MQEADDHPFRADGRRSGGIASAWRMARIVRPSQGSGTSIDGRLTHSHASSCRRDDRGRRHGGALPRYHGSRAGKHAMQPRMHACTPRWSAVLGRIEKSLSMCWDDPSAVHARRPSSAGLTRSSSLPSSSSFVGRVAHPLGRFAGFRMAAVQGMWYHQASLGEYRHRDPRVVTTRSSVRPVLLFRRAPYQGRLCDPGPLSGDAGDLSPGARRSCAIGACPKRGWFRGCTSPTRTPTRVAGATSR